MQRITLLAFVCCLWAIGMPGAAAVSSAPAQQGAAAVAAQTSTQRETLDRYCVTCHNAKLKTGGLSLESMSLGDIPAHADVWEAVVRKLRTATMPPLGMPRPEEKVSASLAGWLERTIDASPGVVAGTARVSVEPSAASFACDPRRLSAGAALKNVEARLSRRGLKLTLLELLPAARLRGRAAATP